MRPRLFASLLLTAAACLPLSAHAQATPEIESYVNDSLLPFLDGQDVLKKELAAANATRGSWTDYSEDWKAWSPADADANQASYTYGEYLWSARKDRSYRKLHTNTPAADALKAFQEASGGKVQEFFVTDARGGNVVQTQLTSDWFQGDEAKFTEVANKKAPFYGSLKRDETVGTEGLHVSIPIWDGDTFLGVAVVFVLK